MSADTIPHRLLSRAQTNPGDPAYYARHSGEWKATDFKTYAEQTTAAARALIALGFKEGDAVCILGFNCPEWSIVDLAAMMAGGLAAGIYTTCSPGEVSYIVNHSEAEIVLVENQHQWDKLAAERANLPKLKHIVLMPQSEAIDAEGTYSWADFLAKGQDTPEATVHERLAAVKPEQLAQLIYTSGTTGPPKGVMLSHDNLSWTANGAVAITSSTPADHSLSYLPLCHIAEQMFTIHGPITGGYAVYYAESMEKLPDNLKEVQPTVFFGVPRVYEKFYDGVTSKLSKAEGTKLKLVSWAQRVGRQVAELENAGSSPGIRLSLQFWLANKLVYAKLKEAIGMKSARILVTGAAPINPEIQHFFSGFDLIIREVYGQSEDCGPTSFNIPGRTKFGTVGPAFPGVEIKIADDGEILVRGPNVFMGYYKDTEATAATLADGWLYSGDLGAFDDQQFLCITGRKKDIIITAGGKNIAPKNIEAALQGLLGVSQAVVIGDRRKYLSALLTLNPDIAAEKAKQLGIPASELHTSDAFIASIQSGVDSVNEQFARVEHVRKFTILPREFSVEDGELTPTMKIKRRIVNENWGDTIEQMY
jgi:long-chain acyl-CoA synthetase